MRRALHVQIRVYRRILQISPHMRQKYRNLLDCPAQKPQNLQAHTLNAIQQILLEELGDIAVIPPLGPGARGPVEALLHDVLEASLSHVALVVRRVDPRPPDLGRALDHQLAPAVERSCRRVGAALHEAHGEVGILELEPAARRERVVGGADDLRRVAKAGKQRSAVDEVELCAEGPLVFGVVDLEVAVRRYAVDVSLSRGFG